MQYWNIMHNYHHIYILIIKTNFTLLKNNTKFSYEIEILYITLTHIYCSRSIAALGLSLCRVRCDYFSTRLVTRQLYRDIVERPNYCMSIFSSIPLGWILNNILESQLSSKADSFYNFTQKIEHHVRNFELYIYIPHSWIIIQLFFSVRSKSKFSSRVIANRQNYL